MHDLALESFKQLARHIYWLIGLFFILSIGWIWLEKKILSSFKSRKEINQRGCRRRKQ